MKQQKILRDENEVILRQHLNVSQLGGMREILRCRSSEIARKVYFSF